MHSSLADPVSTLSSDWRRRATGITFRRFVLAGAAGLILCAAPPALARQEASVGGTVTDAQGAPVPGVAVTAQPEMASDPARAATTDANGQFALTLAPGAYTFTFALSGFEIERREGVQATDGPTVLDVTLQLAAITEQVDVVAVTPLGGVGIDRDRMAAAITVIDGGELQARGTASMADALHERIGAISLEGTTTNLFQPTLRFRGFTASPLLGLPQGVAVYQNGVRINEPFGDTVQFDLLPQFALDRVQLSAGSDPTYGLNALGGSLSLGLRNGFDHAGFRGEFSGGAFGRLSATAEYGANAGSWAFYGGATHFTEDGWRAESPSEVTQAFADVGYRSGGTDAGISFTYADTLLTGNAPAPVELLEVDRTAVFTFPDATENRLAFVQGRANVAASDVWSVQVTGYYRDLDRRTLNGDEGDFGVCDHDALPPGAPEGTLCFGADDDDDDDDNGHDHDDNGHDHDGDDDDHGDHDDDDHDDHGDGDDDDHDDDHGDEEEAATPLVDLLSGRFITSLDAAGDGAYNRTTTLAQGYGATLQATAATGGGGGRENVFVVGVSADLADVDFESSSEPGSLTQERGVAGSGLRTSLYGLGGDDLFNARLETANRAFGLYFSDTLSLSERAHITFSGRYNHAGIDITDRLGSSLDGSHTFGRFNPAVGAVIEGDENTSFFARYSESNRAPTAAELSCADPDEPCRVPNAFVSDPPLDQTVARSFDVGVRGRWESAGGRGSWSVSAYRTRIDDDILFVASPSQIGAGYFQNAGATDRSGLDVELNGQAARTSWYASFGLVDATFASSLRLPGDDEVNDAASDDGTIAVSTGDRLPGIPRHSLKLGVRQSLTDAWDAALETVLASSRYFLGDEGNDQVTLDGYGVLNLRSSYRFANGVELFARIENLLDAWYATSGVLAELEVHLREAPDASDPRFVGPGPPRSAFGGVRVQF